MQHNGTAVLDRTEPAQVSQSRPEPATAARENLVSEVHQLPYGELAVALYASSMPASRAARGKPSVEQIEAWAAEGLARLGAAGVWRLTWRTRQACCGPERRAIWPNAHREGAACDMAYAYLCAREAEGDPWPHAEWVDVAYVGEYDGLTYVVRHDRRDLEYAQRYGWPSSVLLSSGAQVQGSDHE